jgi:hypothetical protein
MKYSVRDKLMLSLKKLCEVNMEVQQSQDPVSDLRSKLSSLDQDLLDQQLCSLDVVPPLAIIQQRQHLKSASSESHHLAN